jgi:pilus assembly protein CpaE
MGLEIKLPSAAQEAECSLLACIGDEATRETVSLLVAQLGWRQAKVYEGGVAMAAQAIEPANPPGLLVVDLADSADPMKALDELAEHCPPETKVIVIGAVNDIVLYRRLLSIGILDYLVKPVDRELLKQAFLNAARPVEQHAPAASAPVKQTRLVAMIGARGGAGTTTLAAGLGWCISEEQQQRVALIDLDLQFGNLALSLDLEPGRGLREALEHPERIDSLLITGAMSGTTEKLRVLAAEEPLDDQPRLDPSSVDPLIAALNDSFDCIIADLPRGLDGMARRLLARADVIAVVADLSLAAMRDAHRLLGLIGILKPGAKPLVIVNRAGALPRGEVAKAEFEKGIQRKIDVVVPYDAKAASAMHAHGKTLPAAARSGKAAAELRKLAKLMTGDAKEKPTSLVKRWFK